MKRYLISSILVLFATACGSADNNSSDLASKKGKYAIVCDGLVYEYKNGQYLPEDIVRFEAKSSKRYKDVASAMADKAELAKTLRATDLACRSQARRANGSNKINTNICGYINPNRFPGFNSMAYFKDINLADLHRGNWICTVK